MCPYGGGTAFRRAGDGLNVLVLLLGMLVILSVSGGAGGGGALLWHAVLTAACICFSCWVRGQGGMVVPLALVAAGLVGVLAIQMRHAHAVPDGRGGIRLAGGLVCVAVLAQVIVSEGAADMMARLMGLVGLSAIVCGVWAACVTRGVVALCAGLACAVDGMMLLGAQADSIPVIIEALVVAAGLNWVMADLFRDGGGQP